MTKTPVPVTPPVASSEQVLRAWLACPTRQRQKAYFIITPDGTVKIGEGVMTLADAQSTVGGYIEYAPRPLPGIHVIANEEGLIMRMTPNPLASDVARRHLVGPVIVANYNCVR